MKTLSLKKIEQSELQAKYMILKASELFDEKTLKLLEFAIQRGMPVELDEKQVDILESLKMVEPGTIKEVVKEKTPNVVATNQRQQGEEEKTAEVGGQIEEDEISTTTIEEDLSVPENEPTIENERAVDGVEILEEPKGPEEIENPDEDEEHQINATVTIESDEEKEDKKQFMPQSIEEIQDMPPEQVQKMFYLSPDRIIESMKRINNGKVWDSLASNEQNKIDLQKAIERAYQSCVYPNDLTNPDFLDERVGAYLPQNNQAIQLKDLHMAALMGTYVGYHIEQNEGDINNLDADGNERGTVAILRFPALVSEMPEELKSQTRTDLANAINLRVKEIMNMSDSYKALMIISPIEETMDKAMEDYAKGLDDSDENKAVKAYIKTVRYDMIDEMKTNFDNLNVSLDLYGINWNNKDTRQSVINMIKNIQGEGKDIDVSKFVEEINMSFKVNSVRDLDAVRAMCADLSELAEQDIEVNIAFQIPPEQLTDPELQRELDAVVNEYENIKRDDEQELVENGVDYVMAQAIRNAAGLPPIPLGGARENSSPSLVPFSNEDIIHGISMAATAISAIEQAIEGPELGFTRTNGGSGT